MTSQQTWTLSLESSCFQQEIKRLSLLRATIVAPDEGARDRCQAVARAAGMTEDVLVLEKKKNT